MLPFTLRFPAPELGQQTPQDGVQSLGLRFAPTRAPAAVRLGLLPAVVRRAARDLPAATREQCHALAAELHRRAAPARPPAAVGVALPREE